MLIRVLLVDSKLSTYGNKVIPNCEVTILLEYIDLNPQVAFKQCLKEHTAPLDQLQ